MPDPKPLVTTYVDLLWQSAPLTALVLVELIYI